MKRQQFTINVGYLKGSILNFSPLKIEFSGHSNVVSESVENCSDNVFSTPLSGKGLSWDPQGLWGLTLIVAFGA